MAKDKVTKEFNNLVLLLRLILTAVLAVTFLLVFFLCGGGLLLFDRIGNVKCFASNEFEVHFIDVGQGDCAFIRFPDNTNMLIDAGPRNSGDNVCNYLKDVFKQENIIKINRFLITHQDTDHVGGAVKVFEEFQVDYFYRPTVLSTYEVETFGNSENYKQSNGKCYDQTIVASYNEPNCTINYSKAGIYWGGENYSVEFLSPNYETYSNSNAYSAVVKITYNNRSFLFTGDAEFNDKNKDDLNRTENELISLKSDKLKADVLKVAHHGAATSTSNEFLSFVKPSLAVMSVGKGNSYGHPADETIARLQEYNCDIYMTSTYGSIAMSVDKNGNIIIGGKNNTLSIDLTIVVIVFIVGVLIIWGIQPNEKKYKKRKIKSEQKREKKTTKQLKV